MGLPPADEILVLITYARKVPLNARADLSSRARGLNFGLALIYTILCICEQGLVSHLPEGMLLNNAIITKFSCVGSYFLCFVLSYFLNTLLI